MDLVVARVGKLVPSDCAALAGRTVTYAWGGMRKCALVKVWRALPPAPQG